MKILMVVGSFPVIAETFIVNQITGLLDRGHDVYIYAREQGNIQTVHKSVHDYKLLERVFYKTPPPLATFDIVMCQFGSSGRNFIYKKNRSSMKSKFVTCFRGRDLSADIAHDPRTYDNLFTKGDLFLPVANFFKDKLIELGCDEEKIIVLHSAIDSKKFAFKNRSLPEDGTVRIITTGRLVEKKGIEYAIRAVIELHKNYPKVQYTIIGDGILKVPLQDFIRQNNAESFIHLAGACTAEEVVEHLDQSHIFVLPSVTAEDGNQEGIPNALKEAMAMGLITIGTYHSGTPELIIHGKTGFLAPERDINALVKHIDYAIRHPECWPAITHAARLKIEQEYEMQHLNDTLEKILLKLIAKK